jgi:hypothetical protein
LKIPFLGKVKSKDLVKFRIGHFKNVQKMSRGLKLFYKKHEKSKGKHNGKVPIKLGSMLLSTGKKKKCLKKDLGTFSLPLLWNQW